MKRIAVFCISVLFLLIVGCGGSSQTFSADTPEGAVSGYYQALKDGKPEVAYQYKKFTSPITKEQFVREKKGAGMSFKNFTVQKGKVTGNTASVPVKFETGISSMPELTLNIQLVKEKTWLIKDSGMGGKPGHGSITPGGAGSAPSGMPPTGSGSAPVGMPPAGAGK